MALLITLLIIYFSFTIWMIRTRNRDLWNECIGTVILCFYVVAGVFLLVATFAFPVYAFREESVDPPRIQHEGKWFVVTDVRTNEVADIQEISSGSARVVKTFGKNLLGFEVVDGFKEK